LSYDHRSEGSIVGCEKGVKLVGDADIKFYRYRQLGIKSLIHLGCV